MEIDHISDLEFRKSLGRLELPNVGETVFGSVEIVQGVDAEGCVDPRDSFMFNVQPEGLLAEALHYPQMQHTEHAEGAERAPGGGFGKVLALMGAVLDMEPALAVKLVAAWETSEGRSLSLHGDTHAHGDGLGCGHVDRSRMPTHEDLYGIKGSRVQEALDIVRETLKEGRTIDAIKTSTDESLHLKDVGEFPLAADVPILVNEHSERGVLVVLSDLFEPRTVTAKTSNGLEMFRFDATRYDASLGRLAAYVAAQGVPLKVEDLKAAADKQRNATLKLLAKGLPIFEVDLRGGKNEITHIGIVD